MRASQRVQAISPKSASSNVVYFFAPRGGVSRLTGFLETMLRDRHSVGSQQWLTESSFLMQMLETSQQHNVISDDGIFTSYYQSLAGRLQLNPQAYKDYLSLALSFEELTGADAEADGMMNWILSRDLPTGEMNDIDRLEASWLMARRGRRALPYSAEKEMQNRVQNYIARADLFAQSPRGRELFRALGYLTDFGRLPAILPGAVRYSLRNAGFYALLSGDIETLALVCVAHRFVRLAPPQEWEALVTAYLDALTVTDEPQPHDADCFDGFVAANWMLSAAGRPAFARVSDQTGAWFICDTPPLNALPQIEAALAEISTKRSGEWADMQAMLFGHLGEEETRLLLRTSRTAGFEAFFEVFARPFEQF